MLVVQPGHTVAAGDADGAGFAGFSGVHGLEKQGALVAHLDHIDVQAHQGAPVDGAGVGSHHDHIGGTGKSCRRLTDIDPHGGGA